MQLRGRLLLTTNRRNKAYVGLWALGVQELMAVSTGSCASFLPEL
jgi:hypothetical protein